MFWIRTISVLSSFLKFLGMRISGKLLFFFFKFKDGMQIRGDLHICLMGDPGVAKCQLLKHIINVSAFSRSASIVARSKICHKRSNLDIRAGGRLIFSADVVLISYLPPAGLAAASTAVLAFRDVVVKPFQC